MRQLRDSGVEWLGAVPDDWEVVRSKALFREARGRSEAGHEELLTVSHITGVTPRSQKDVNMFEAATKEGYKLCRKNDLAINTMWAWMGALGISPCDGIVSPSYNVYEPADARGIRYYDYLLRTPAFVAEINRWSKGVWKSRLRLYPSEFSRIMLPAPPPAVREAIANFLDRKTAAIDALIEKKERLIALLQEKRQALITQSVTKGLDPSVPMKDSGIEWLGEIPAHWEVMRVKHAVGFVTSGSRGWSEFFSEDGAYFIQSGNLDRKQGLDFRTLQHVRPPAGGEGTRTAARHGDLLVCITGALTGNVSVVREDLPEAYVNQHLALVRPRPECADPSYLAFALAAQPGQAQFLMSQYGGTKQGLGLDDVKNVVFAAPPVEQQREISASVWSMLAAIESTVAKLGQSVERLVEYRQALITAAVTGQVDVNKESA